MLKDLEATFRQIVSGDDLRLRARLVRLALATLAAPYRCAIAIRNWLYDRGVLPAQRVQLPVISIGNLTLGGTGKTPFVEFVCRWYQSRGKRPAILSRGYRGQAGSLPHGTVGLSVCSAAAAPNDEARLLQANLPDVPHLQGKDRVALARFACDRVPSDVLVLDDGFQHRRLARNLDIVLIDCTEPFGYGRIFPRGLLREPIANLRRADLIVLSRANQCTPDTVAAIRRQVIAAAGDKPIVMSEQRPRAVRFADGQTWPVSSLVGRSVAAFCGIGNPTAFWKTLTNVGCRLAGTRALPDHHAYSPADLNELCAWANELDCEFVVTTQKDQVKIPQHELAGRPLVALQIEVLVHDAAGQLDRALARVLSGTEPIRQAA